MIVIKLEYNVVYALQTALHSSRRRSRGAQCSKSNSQPEWTAKLASEIEIVDQNSGSKFSLLTSIIAPAHYLHEQA